MAGMNEEGRQWYVVNTYAGHENKVKENLTKRIESMNLGDYLFNIVVPEIEREVVVNGTRKIEKENLYPCKNDKGYDWWTTQGKLVIEDGEYSSSVAAVMSDWIAYL